MRTAIQNTCALLAILILIASVAITLTALEQGGVA